MAYVIVEDRNLERALREFKKQVRKEGIIEKCKQLKSFVPNSQKRRNVKKRFRRRIFQEKFKGRQ